MILLGASAVLLGSCHKETPLPAAQPSGNARVVYELREKCGKDANEWFKREHSNDGVLDGDVITTIQDEYTNHYNEKLNRCYALVLKSTLIHAPKGKHGNTKSATLVDVNENAETGSYFENDESARPIKCFVRDSVCGSLTEWNALASPYMIQ